MQSSPLAVDTFERRRSSYLWCGPLIGMLIAVMGLAAWWYNWHLAATAGHFYIKLCIFAPLAVGGGLMVMFRPDWAGPITSASTQGHKVALGVLIGWIAVASGVDMYLLKRHDAPRQPITQWNPQRGTPSSLTVAPPLFFYGRTYKLGAFNQQHNATWEYVTGNEDVNTWSTLLTVVDRPDARNREDQDRLAEGLLSAYRSNGAQILAAKTMRDQTGVPFNYIVAAFDQPAEHRMELSFVKVALSEGNAVVLVYGVRITDSVDHRSKAKEYLNQHSADTGSALGRFPVPDTSRLPRR